VLTEAKGLKVTVRWVRRPGLEGEEAPGDVCWGSKGEDSPPLAAVAMIFETTEALVTQELMRQARVRRMVEDGRAGGRVDGKEPQL
jgi:hypothetical protein